MFKINYFDCDYRKAFTEYWENDAKPYLLYYFTTKGDNFVFSYKEIFTNLIINRKFLNKSPLHNNSILFRYVILGLTDPKIFWEFIMDYKYKSNTFTESNEPSVKFIKNTFLKNILQISTRATVKKVFKQMFTHLHHNYIFKFKSLLQIILFNVKWLLLAGIIAGLYFVVSLFYIQIDFTKQIAAWYILMITYYLLMSTFNSFVSKYRYGKFTTGIQRFWKRTGIIFWILEGFLFVLFFYYFLNSSQEPLYMFDYANLNQEYLLQIRISYKSMMWLTFIIYLCLILIVNLNYKTYYQNILLLMFISLCVFYTLYIESYQFVYVFSLLQNRVWTFDDTDQTWSFENEQNNIRTKQQYFILCLVGKYWHFIFIFISWFFFLIKSLEVNKINITLLSYNTQNIVILYWLNLICLIQWVKVFYKKFFELSYSWFYFQFDEKFFAMFSLEFWYMLNYVISFDFDVKLVKHIIITSQSLCLSNELSLWKYIK